MIILWNMCCLKVIKLVVILCLFIKMREITKVAPGFEYPLLRNLPHWIPTRNRLFPSMCTHQRNTCVTFVSSGNHRLKFLGDQYSKCMRQFNVQTVYNSETYDELMKHLEQLTVGKANQIVNNK